MAELFNACNRNVENVFEGTCPLDYDSIVQVILTPEDYVFDTVEAINTLTTWNTKLNDTKAERFYKLPRVKDFAQSGGDPRLSSNFDGSNDIAGRNAKILDFTFKNLPAQVTNAIETHNGRTIGVLFIDKNRNLLCTKVGESFGAFDARVIVREYNFAGGDDAQSLVVGFEIDDTVQYTSALASTKVSKAITNLTGIRNLYLTEVSASTSQYVVNVVDQVTGAPVTNLVADDFKFTPTTGADINPTGLTVDTNGNYTLTVAIPAGTYVLDISQPDATTKFVEAFNPITLTTTN